MKTKAASTDDDPLNESDNELDNELYSGSDVVKVRGGSNIDHGYR